MRKNFKSRVVTVVTTLAVVAFIICSFPGMVFANSGPVFWQGYPYSDSMLIDDNSPITVKNEDLVFDFSDNEDSDHSVSGQVTATYQMINPTKQPQSVQMAFPVVESLDHFFPENITITADNIKLPYHIYIGDMVKSDGSSFQGDQKVDFDFAEIVNTITDKTYQGNKFGENEKGKLYSINVQPNMDQRINLSVDFNFNDQKTKVVTNGFNRYERDGEKTKIAAWCYEPRTLEILVLGEDMEFTINGYLDGELKEKTDLFNYEIGTEEIKVKSYLMGRVKEHSNVKNEGVVSDTQLYNLYAKSLNRFFIERIGYSSIEDLRAEENYKRVLTFVYTVDFPENSEKEVTVGYITSGTMDMTKTSKPQYYFDYILNPAKNWGDFENLNIKIIPPKKAPYIVQSTITLEKGENNVYTAALPNLPEDKAFSFTLYEKAKISPVDLILGNWKAYGFLNIVMIGVLALIVMGIFVFRRRPH